MLLVQTFIRPSVIHGIGLFAAEKIESGQRVLEFDPLIDVAYSRDALARLPALALTTLLFYGQYMEDGKFIICGDDARFVNHADNPNIKNFGAYYEAIKFIAKGEEITEDYRAIPRGEHQTFMDCP